MTEAAAKESFGGFALGALQMALPMAALREVMPCAELAELPCPAACVIGGISVRGAVVPVVDLRIVLGRPLPAEASRNVVIMMYEGKILGLIADAVTGIFDALPGTLRRSSVADSGAAIFLAGAVRADNQTMVSVLSPEALARLPQVPMVEDPEPTRQATHADADGAAAAEAADAAVPMMLLHCGGIPLAVEAMVVHATLSNPAVAPSALATQHCRGVVDYAGLSIPAIDLQSLCGLGRMDLEGGAQAFVASLAAGQVAFLIGGVVDVVQTSRQDVRPVPAFALPRSGLFAGALPLSALPDDLVERAGTVVAQQYLVIDATRLRSCPEVVALSGLNVASDASAGDGGAASATGSRPSGRRSMLTYQLQSEHASPLEQVIEILRWQPVAQLVASDGPLLGFIVNRGRSIPVLCLDRIAGGGVTVPTESSVVLLVESRGELIGFAVPALKGIEEADWEPALPDLRPSAVAALRVHERRPRQLALVGSGETERMLPLLDLHSTAESLQELALAA